MEKIKSFQESFDLIKRDPKKHLGKVLGLWMMPVMFRGGGIIRDSYFFMRHVDDVLDGDDMTIKNPNEYVEKIRMDLEEDKLDISIPIETLAFKSIERLERKKRMVTDNPRTFFLNGIDGMFIDFNRVRNRELVNNSSLKGSFIKSFGPHFDISLMAIESGLRSSDITTFLYAQGFAYSIQDLKIDWERGLFNVPLEVLNQAGLSGGANFSEVNTSSIIKEWIADESSKIRFDLDIFLKNIGSCEKEKSANLLIGGLSRRVISVLDSKLQNS